LPDAMRQVTSYNEAESKSCFDHEVTSTSGSAVERSERFGVGGSFPLIG
jgi:hypothetical protein